MQKGISELAGNGKNSKLNGFHQSGPGTRGPVKNLESFVEADWWKKLFNSLYLKTDADVVDDIEITRGEIDRYLEILQLKPDSLILDLCCGQGRHALELSRRGFDSTGLDRSRYLIQKARISARRENLAARFREGDARKLPFESVSFDHVFLLGNSFGYFETLNDDVRVLREIHRVLNVRGRVLIDITDGEYMAKSYKSRSWEWIDENYFVCRERSLSADQQRLISREIISHAQKGVVADQFYAERLYTKDSIRKLLESVGYQDIQFHDQVFTKSQRNQDLGMMEKRLILTAAVNKRETPVTAVKRNKLLNVAVLMGDPRKEDRLKPDSIFDEDDFQTIDCLKQALTKLEGYRFCYLNNHDQLIQDLVRMRPNIDYVFNLCDEGFNNDARHELHVPALLEMLKMPYTGSNPQCLAYCYDKSLIRGIAREMDISVPQAVFINSDDNIYGIPISFPVLVKPNFGDSSLGITQKSYAENIEQLVDAIQNIRDKFGYEKPIIVEEFLPGADLSVGVIGNLSHGFQMLPIIEEDYSKLPEGLPKICGYEAKWIPQSPYWQIKSRLIHLEEKTQKYIEEACFKLMERLECRDYCRFDWRLDAKGMPKILEVNPNPGWCWDGHLAKMAALKGMSYAAMVEDILKAAEQRLNILLQRS